MKVAVYDTHIAKETGGTMHFSIMVPDGLPHEKVMEIGNAYLDTTGQKKRRINSNECELCYSGSSVPFVRESISTKGYFIYEMEGCR